MSTQRGRPTSADDYGHGTHSHRSRLLRFSHRRRFDHALDLLQAKPDSRVLDYGSGDGYLLQQLLPKVPATNMVAFEPLDYLQEQIRSRFKDEPIRLISVIDDLMKQRFNRIACLEVLEHLQPMAVQQTLTKLEELLLPGGVLVISVPVEIGPTILFKYLAARIEKGSNRSLSIPELIKASLYGSVKRDTQGSFISHKGFDYRQLRTLVTRRFMLEHELFSPFPLLRGFLNAQVLWRLRKR